MSKAIWSEQAPQFPLPFSHAVVAGDFVYVSGQVGVKPENRALAGETIEEQTKQTIANIETILKTVGLTLDHIIKMDVHLGKSEDLPAYNRTYAELFNQPYPARTTVVSGIGDYLIEVDCVAYAPQPRQRG
ncbi:2-iminobutanoate/2-iminopropanoate deaminase [Paenibacillus taihuensis]|uniref:2-iminobutanoate/2-iminopropanoate deaminase n=1 Tax=Paenibacillus taihuensis TaxID=1156355 RepID=A0A3D9R371_9BACL|nr:RidA family protein [Paenibacillus taihuensis]REE70522.1 2-iminobutanoate/2-iminopropanoate deaminase [Paenibacillus taihuensis]